MKVLIISGASWHDNTNIGNLLNNMFKNSKFEFAHIYCSVDLPKNDLCKNYYHITDKMVFKNFITHKPIGESFFIDKKTQKKINGKTKNGSFFYSFFHKYGFELSKYLKNFFWNKSNWKNKKIKKFLDDFKPDVIFSFCYEDKFKLRLTRFCSDYTHTKVISYVFDDVYTLKQFNLSPFFWINRFIVRHEIRKTVPYYSLIYTMTETQKKQFAKDFGVKVKILMKPVESFVKKQDKTVNYPIQMIYAGGLYLNRWKTLKDIAKIISKINSEGVKIQLKIYTADIYKNKIKKYLDNQKDTFILGRVSSAELKNIYSTSDIALHVESFDLKNRLKVRMSFSTKITDCLASGCAVMAVCDKKQGGFIFLKKKNLAFCVSNKKNLKTVLQQIVDNPKIITKYAQKAYKYYNTKYNYKKVRSMIITDFLKVK